MGVNNQSCPAGSGSSVLLGVFPCRTDDYPTLKRISASWLPDIDELRANGLLVDGQIRRVALILTGDYSWMSSWAGHAGASCRRPCLWCPALAQRTATIERMVTRDGCIQDGSKCKRTLRTTDSGQEMRDSYGEGPNISLSEPLSPDTNLSIERSPLMVVPASDTAPMPLHLMLGVTIWLFQLAMEIVVNAKARPPGHYSRPRSGRYCGRRLESRRPRTLEGPSRARSTTGLASACPSSLSCWRKEHPGTTPSPSAAPVACRRGSCPSLTVQKPSLTMTYLYGSSRRQILWMVCWPRFPGCASPLSSTPCVATHHNFRGDFGDWDGTASRVWRPSTGDLIATQGRTPRPCC